MNYDCSAILTEKIIDCISLNNTQKSYMDKVTFTLDRFYDNCEFIDGIHITDWKVDYDYIGLRNYNDNETIINSKCYNLDKNNMYTKYNGPLYKECSKSKIYRENNDFYSDKLIIIEKDLIFFLCGLKIYIEGTLGCKKIKGFKAFNKNDKVNTEKGFIKLPQCPMSIKKIGFSPITFIGNIALPENVKKYNLYENFDSCLSIDHIIPKQSKYKKNQYQHNYTGKECDERNKLSLSVVFSLTTTKKIYITNTEVQNVLACSN